MILGNCYNMLLSKHTKRHNCDVSPLWIVLATWSNLGHPFVGAQGLRLQSHESSAAPKRMSHLFWGFHAGLPLLCLSLCIDSVRGCARAMSDTASARSESFASTTLVTCSGGKANLAHAVGQSRVQSRAGLHGPCRLRTAFLGGRSCDSREMVCGNTNVLVVDERMCSRG